MAGIEIGLAEGKYQTVFKQRQCRCANLPFKETWCRMTDGENPANQAKQAPHRKNVLVIGRTIAWRKLWRRRCRSGAWNAQRTNEAALVLLRAQHFNLLLTGDETSGQEDVELLREVRRTRPHLRLIILTNESTPVRCDCEYERSGRSAISLRPTPPKR